jgi:hypothetical protein
MWGIRRTVYVMPCIEYVLDLYFIKLTERNHFQLPVSQHTGVHHGKLAMGAHAEPEDV